MKENGSEPGPQLPSTSRKEFLDMLRGLAVCAVLPESFVSMLKHSANVAGSEEPYGTGECYKRLFDALNYQMSHFPPPEHPNESKYFDQFVALFRHILDVRHNDLLLKDLLGDDGYKKLKSILDEEPRPADDILVMVMSSITTKGKPDPQSPYDPVADYASETIPNSWAQFTSWYTPEMYGSLSESDFTYLVDGLLSDKMHLVRKVDEQSDHTGKSPYSIESVLFGMGDKAWEKFVTGISQLLIAGTSDPQWKEKRKYAEEMYDLGEAYQFGEVNAIKLHRAWEPPLYRCVPAQLDSAQDLSGYDGLVPNDPVDDKGDPLWANGYAQWIEPLLWDWDVISRIIEDNAVKFTRWEKCGCMYDQSIIKAGQHNERASHFADMTNPKNHPAGPQDYFSFCTSFRQKLEESEKDETWFPTLASGNGDLHEYLKTNLQVAEDYNLMHQVFNFVRSDPARPGDFDSFICNCHRDWCLQLRPQNEWWNEKPTGENIKVRSIERAFYLVELKGSCGDCTDCYRTEDPAPDAITFVCPAQAWDDSTKTGKISAGRCLGCLLCVRHCYRKHGKATDVAPVEGQKKEMLAVETKGLRVSRLANEADLTRRLPETRWDRDQQRIAAIFDPNLPEMNWPKFRYPVREG